MPEASGLFPSQSLEPSLGTTSRRHRVSLGRLDRFAGIAAIEVRTRHSLASGLPYQRTRLGLACGTLRRSRLSMSMMTFHRLGDRIHKDGQGRDAEQPRPPYGDAPHLRNMSEGAQ